MLVDLGALPDRSSIEADICIVGAGAAGIAIATSLIGTRHRVCLLESGGLQAEPATQALYCGETAGVPWGPGLTTMRSRYFGGTTNRWPGGCVKLADLDLQPRPWVPHSGWPISSAELDTWYEKARSVLFLPDIPFDSGGRIDRGTPPFAFDPAKLMHIHGLGSRKPRLGAAYQALLARASNVQVVLHANLTRFGTNESRSVVTEAHVQSLDGQRGSVRAQRFILACGGIENARLLLLSGLGNDRVGRFFMDHPFARLGTITTHMPNRLADPYNKQVSVPGVPRPGDICLTPAVQVEKQLLNARMRPQDYEDEEAIPDGVRAFRELRRQPSLDHASRAACGIGDVLLGVSRRLRGKPVVPKHHVDLEGFFEQAPNPDSRVTLAEARDGLGLRQVRLDWQLTELDIRTYRAVAMIFSAELARIGIGRLEPEPWLWAEDEPPRLSGMAHHLGTTRMSDHPGNGVVDTDCRLHGMHNLYAAGGSVFPAGGWAPPTFTIVALALRLADHLDRSLRAPCHVPARVGSGALPRPTTPAERRTLV